MGDVHPDLDKDDDHDDEQDGPDVAEDQAGQCHPVALLPGPPDLAARQVAADDRRDEGEDDGELSYPADQGGDGQGVSTLRDFGVGGRAG